MHSQYSRATKEKKISPQSLLDIPYTTKCDQQKIRICRESIQSNYRVRMKFKLHTFLGRIPELVMLKYQKKI